MSEGVDVYAAGTQLAGAMCWICQTRIMAGDEVVFCPHDNLPSHADCWEHNDGCPLYGCKAAPARGQLAVQALGTQRGAADYQCPHCRQMVKPSFLQCTFCGTPFALQNVVSGLEFEDYQFRYREDHRQQKPLWASLIGAVTGIFAPLVLIILSLMLIKGSLGRFRRSHMFPDTRILFYITYTISALNTLLLLLLIAIDI